MKRGDGTTFWICNGCGRVPIYNEAERLFVCPTCDGPLQFSGVTADTLTLQLPTKQSRVTFSRISIPYTLKLLDQELTTFSNTGLRFVTEGSVARLRDGAWPWPKEEVPFEAAALEDVNPEVRAAKPQRKKDLALVAGVATGPAKGAEGAAEVLAAAGGEVVGAGEVRFSSRIANEYTGFTNFASAPFRMPGAQIPAPDGKQYPEFGGAANGGVNAGQQIWPTVEHYYQAMKFPDEPAWQEEIRQATTPLRAKKMGLSPEHPVRGDWDAIKERVMKGALLAKFRQNPALLARLQETGERQLIEASPGDSYWGIGTRGKGLNRMGALLTEVRTELKDVRVDQSVLGGVQAGEPVGQIVEGPEENAVVLSEPEDVAAEAQEIVAAATGGVLNMAPQGQGQGAATAVMTGGGGVGGSNVFMIINPNIGGDHKARRARARGGNGPISWAGMETTVTKDDGETTEPFGAPGGEGQEGGGNESMEGASITVEKLG